MKKIPFKTLDKTSKVIFKKIINDEKYCINNFVFSFTDWDIC